MASALRVFVWKYLGLVAAVLHALQTALTLLLWGHSINQPVRDTLGLYWYCLLSLAALVLFPWAWYSGLRYLPLGWVVGGSALLVQTLLIYSILAVL